MADTATQLISFTIGKQLLSIPIAVVEHNERAVEVTPLRKVPRNILGIIDYHGEIIPVLNLRKRLGIPDRSVASSDRLIIIRTSSFRMALVVDEVKEVISRDNDPTTTEGMFHDKIETEGITRCCDGLVLIYDPEKLLSSIEELDLDKALKINKKKV